MSRSYKKHSFTGYAVAFSEKKDKVKAHRNLRRRIRQLLKVEPYEEPVLRRNLYAQDPWLWAKDGKIYFPAKEYPKLMRK